MRVNKMIQFNRRYRY